jgi:hypothetical protein
MRSGGMARNQLQFYDMALDVAGEEDEPELSKHQTMNEINK